MKISLYHDSHGIVQRISEIGMSAEIQLIEKKQFAQYTSSIPFLSLKRVLEWEYTVFFSFQVDNKLFPWLHVVS
jgi:hypothetical protein